MAYLAFYRTFRPASFDDVVRQEHIVRILKNQIESGKIGHAYLFCGPRGTGKTTLAKIFARAINCENPQNASPCGRCATCKALSEGSSLDITEIDAASNNGVDEMRDLREKVQYPPVVGRYKVYIIDEVHMLTPSAFNAVLKTLEEPPRHAVFILATTEPHKIPATILSRCMRFDFKLIPQRDLEELIKSVLKKTGKEYEEAAVSAIARAGAGSARDSLSIADMCASYSTGKLTYADVSAVLGSADYVKIADVCGKILQEDAEGSLTAVEEILSTGKSVGVLIKDMLGFLNDLAIVKVCRNSREIINLPDESYNKIVQISKVCDGHKLLRVTEILTKAEVDMRYSTSGRITLETAILKASMPQEDYNIDALIGKINSLETRLKNGEFSVHAEPPKSALNGAYSAPNHTSEAQKSTPAEDSKAQPSGNAVKISDGGVTHIEESKAQPSGNAVKIQDNGVTPFDGSESRQGERATAVPASSDMVFGKFIRALRTTHKNAVIFTLCMDLNHFFEGKKLILTTSSEAVYKGLVKADNAKFIADVLSELGVEEYEVRLVGKEASDYEKALEELKKNFKGINIEIK